MKRRTHQTGFSLIEILVSTVVAMFATLVVMQAFAVSEGYRRTATSGGDASFSGTLGTYVLDRDLRIAGYGINNANYLGCQVSGSDSGVTPAAAIGPFTLAPVQIAFGGNAQQPDSITVISSNTDMMPGVINLTTGLASPTSDYVVTDAYGVNQGDVLLLAQPGQPCTLAEATNTPTNGATNQNTIKHAAARYNPAGGMGPNYSASAVVMDMGPAPIANQYWIQNNPALPNFDTLMVNQLIADQASQPVAANIVMLKAMYGIDNGTGTVGAWTVAAPATWQSVLAVRVVLVARSAKPEKQNSAGQCVTTLASPSVTWDDGTVTQLDLSGTAAPTEPGWQCYRYRVFHVTSSVRNLIWTPS
ncbi:MAG: PilW family protein [Burkholderiaceae bacterium]|nr:PilW family protein [Burkholderiaceae bacterium]